MDMDDMVIVPVATAMRMFDLSSLFRIMIAVRAHSELERAKERVIEIIVERHDEEPRAYPVAVTRKARKHLPTR